VSGTWRSGDTHRVEATTWTEVGAAMVSDIIFFARAFKGRRLC